MCHKAFKSISALKQHKTKLHKEEGAKVRVIDLLSFFIYLPITYNDQSLK
jgi:hypothetical protein